MSVSGSLDRDPATIGRWQSGTPGQVFENLIENAVKYGESGGKVDVAIESIGASHGEKGPHVTFTVQDYGPGIAPEHLEHVFEPFVSGNTRRGLGLWVTYQIVRQLGGEIAAPGLKR